MGSERRRSSGKAGKTDSAVAGDGDNVQRVLQFRVRPVGDAAQFLALMKSATPFYQAFGGRRFRFLRNVDDPAQLLVEIEYETHAGLELNRQKVASDPMVRTFLQGWRTMLAGNAEVDVYEDVSGA
jgi:hypothetical protein